MKTAPVSSPLSLTILILALLFVAVVFVGVTGKKVPLLSNVRLDIILLVVIGMAICSQGGIGRVAASGQWSNPFSIIGYVLGGLILLVALSVFVGWNMVPWWRPVLLFARMNWNLIVCCFSFNPKHLNICTYFMCLHEVICDG